MASLTLLLKYFTVGLLVLDATIDARRAGKEQPDLLVPKDYRMAVAVINT